MDKEKNGRHFRSVRTNNSPDMHVGRQLLEQMMKDQIGETDGT